MSTTTSPPEIDPRLFLQERPYKWSGREKEFQSWYKEQADKLKLDPDPDNPLHFYDWRRAFDEGAKPDKQGHWPSDFKLLGHPNLIVQGLDTRTQEPASKELIIENTLRYLKVLGTIKRD